MAETLQQTQTFSLRISEVLRKRLEDIRKLTALRKGESVSTSEIAKQLLESAREDRFEVVELLNRPSEALWNPLTYTDPSGQFLCAVCAGSTLGPVGTAVGAAVDAAALLYGIFGFGGGSRPDLSSVEFTPGPLQPTLGGGTDSDPFAGQAADGSGGSGDPGSLFFRRGEILSLLYSAWRTGNPQHGRLLFRIAQTLSQGPETLFRLA